jgi:hypothetical protein
MPFWGLHPLLCLFFQCFLHLGEEVKRKSDFGLADVVFPQRGFVPGLKLKKMISHCKNFGLTSPLHPPDENALFS